MRNAPESVRFFFYGGVGIMFLGRKIKRRLSSAEVSKYAAAVFQIGRAKGVCKIPFLL